MCTWMHPAMALRKAAAFSILVAGALLQTGCSTHTFQVGSVQFIGSTSGLRRRFGEINII